MTTTLTSVTNPTVKSVVSLHSKKSRQEANQLLVETRHPIEEAIKAGLTVRHYFCLEGTPVLAGIPESAVQVVADSVMKKMATTTSVPPCLAVVDAPDSKQLTALKTQTPLVLLLDALQDPGNMGTLLRSAVAFGVDAVMVTTGTVDPYSPKVIRASAGLVFALPVIPFEPTALPSDWLVYAALPSGAGVVPYRDAAYQRPCILLLGSEGQGISESLLADLPEVTPVTIPMVGCVESLNVATSGSILLAEMAAKHHKN